jgi:hypothetical protein
MPLLEDLYAKQRARRAELPGFFYSTSITTLGAAPDTKTGTIGIQADSHFVARYMNITPFTGAANAQVVAATTAPLLIQLTDTGSGRTLFDNPQPVQNCCGGAISPSAQGNAPFIFPEPWLIRAGGSINVTLTNLGSVVFTRIDLSLIGMKVFPFGQTTLADI